MKHISLFSGIGGFDLAAQWAGWTNIASCEINTFGRRVLEYYWPDAYHHDDIKTLTGSIIEHEAQRRYGPDWRADGVILSGGFPCQPYSLAGKRLGKNDDRHLWPEMLRLIREIAPDWIVGENVSGLVNWSDGLVFDEVQSDLEAIGYEIQAFILPACAVNAPHRRDRVWIIARNSKSNGEAEVREVFAGWKSEQSANAERISGISGKNGKIWPTTNADSNGQQRSNGEHEKHAGKGGEYAQRDVGAGAEHGNAANANRERHEERDIATVAGKQKRQHCKEDFKFRNTDWHDFPTQSPICVGNDGFPAELDGITFPKWRNESIKAAGNAVVPQVVLKIFEAINTIHSQHN